MKGIANFIEIGKYHTWDGTFNGSDLQGQTGAIQK